MELSWEGMNASNDLDIYGARVSTDGVVLDPAGIPISTLINNQYAPERVAISLNR
jgi:hypothetical protein